MHYRTEIRLKKKVVKKPTNDKDFYYISTDEIPEELNKKYVNGEPKASTITVGTIEVLKYLMPSMRTQRYHQ